MVDNTSTNFPIDKMRFVDQESGFMTKEARTLLRALWNRTGGGTGGDIATVKARADAAFVLATAANATALKKASNLADLTDAPTARNSLGLGSVALGNTVPGWINPTGAGSHVAINANFTQTAAATYSQTDYQAVIDQLIAVQKALAQLILDAKSARVISN
jgi:hypothetical protein